MRLNMLQPAPGSKSARKRVGRGIGSGLGKTAGRGHKGQKSRSGGLHKVGFEGGQMPLQRRSELNGIEAEVVDLQALIDADVLARHIATAKIIASGSLQRPVKVRGVRVTKGARAAIEAAGGSVED